MKNAFSMLELVFVIIVIGILAGMAIPRLFNGITEAEIAKIKTDVATIRSAIATKYGKNIMEGKNECPSLENTTTDPDNKTLFEGIMTYPIKRNVGDVKWDGDGTDYSVTMGKDTTIYFKYDNKTSNNCKFECDTSKTDNRCDLIGE